MVIPTIRNPMNIRDYMIREPAGFVWLMNELIPLYKIVGMEKKAWLRDCKELGLNPSIGEDGSIWFHQTWKMIVTNT